MAGSFVYIYDHRYHFSDYFQVLHTWEWIAAVACAAPGFVWVGACQLRDYRKEQAKLQGMEVTGADDTVWPPAPRK